MEGTANPPLRLKTRNEGPFKLFPLTSQSHASSQSSNQGEQQPILKFGSHRQSRPPLFNQRGAQPLLSNTDCAHISSSQPPRLAFRPTRKASTPFSSLPSQAASSRSPGPGEASNVNGSQGNFETMDGLGSDPSRFSSPLDEVGLRPSQNQTLGAGSRAYTPAPESDNARKSTGGSIFSFNPPSRESALFSREPQLGHNTRPSLVKIPPPSPSRAASTPRPDDLLNNDQEQEMGIVVAALKDVSRLKGELNEERHRNRELSSSLEHTSGKFEELQSKCQQQELALRETQQKLGQTTSELAELRRVHDMERDKARENYTSTQRLNQQQVEELSSKFQVLQTEYVQNTEQARAERDARMDEFGRVLKENKELRHLSEKAKEQLQTMGQNFKELQTAHVELRASYDQDFRNKVVGKSESGNPEDLATVLTEVRGIRGWAKDRLRGLEPAIDLESGEWKKLQELRSTITELEEGLAASHRVIDMLRDKMHHVTSQLAESQSRVVELETEKHELWMSWSTQLQQNTKDTGENQCSLVVLKEKITTLVEVHEKTSLDALAAAAEAERKLFVAEERMKALNQVVEENKGLQEELAKARQEIAGLSKLRDDLTAKLSSIQASEAELIAKVTKQENDIRQLERERERSAIKIEEDGKAKTELKKESSARQMQLEDALLQLKECSAAENFANNKVKELQDEMKAIKGVLEKKDESARRLETQYAILEERLDAQAATLRLTKEHNGDLQERIVHTEASHAKQLESATANLKTEIAILQEQKTTLEGALKKLQQALDEQRSALQAANQAFEKRLGAQQEASDKLFQAELRRSELVDKTALEAKATIAQQQSKVQDLERSLEALKQDISQRDESLKSAEVRAQDQDNLRLRLSELEGETATLKNRAQTLKERYKAGQLAPEEIGLVHALVADTRELHERDLLDKDNELRRRDKTISNMNSRIKTLESTIARQIKELGTIPMKSMVDVNLWVGSSPKDLGGGPPLGGLGLSVAGKPTEAIKNTVFATPGKHVSAGPSPPGPTFARLAHSDSDDDIPLSELSRLSSSLGKRPREASPTPKEPVQHVKPLRAPNSRSAATSKKTGEGITKPKQRRKKA